MNPIGRCNKLTLTDGHRHCVAVDFHSILQIYQQQGYVVKSGSKIALRNVLVRRSALCLDADSVCLLGGTIENDGQSQVFRELIGFPTIVSTADSNSSSSRRAPPVSSSITAPTSSAGVASNSGGRNTAPTVPSSITAPTSTAGVASNSATSGPSGGRNTAVNNGSGGSMVDLTSSSSSSLRAAQSPPQPTAPLISYSSVGSSYNARPNRPSTGRNDATLVSDLPMSTAKTSPAAREIMPTGDATICLLSQPTLDLLLAEEQELMMIVDADPLTSFTSSTTPMVSPPPKSSSSSGSKQWQTNSDVVDDRAPTLQNIQNVCSNPMVNAGIIRGFASRIYRCKLHTPKHSDSGERASVVLSRAFLRSYLAQSDVATSTIQLEIIVEFHDGYRSIPVMLHPHLSCRFLALHLSTILNVSDRDPPVEDTAPLAMDDILLCFQQFQGFFMASRYPLSSSGGAAVLSPYVNGFADELRQMGDRFVRKFSQQSATGGGQLSNNGSQSQHQSQYPSGPGGSGVSTQSSQSSSPTSMLMLLDLATWDPVVAATAAGMHLSMSAKKRMRAETAEGRPTVLSDIGGGVSIESLIRQKQSSWHATA